MKKSHSAGVELHNVCCDLSFFTEYDNILNFFLVIKWEETEPSGFIPNSVLVNSIFAKNMEYSNMIFM